MNIDRRSVLTGAGLVAAVSVAGSVSACSPSSSEELYSPQNFFGKIASRKFEDAREMLAAKASMLIITFSNQQIFTGQKDVIGQLSNMVHSDGYKMIGDNGDYAPGGYWEQFGGWHISDMIKGNAVVLNNCGSADLVDPVLNIYVATRYLKDKAAIQQIILMESRNLNFSRVGELPEPFETGEMPNG